MAETKQQIIAFFALLLLVTFVIVMMWLPFFRLFAFGAILAVLFLPLYKRLLIEVKYEAIAAGLTLAVIFFIILIPVYLVGQVIFNELVNVYTHVRGGGPLVNQTELLQNLPEPIKIFTQNLFNSFGQRLAAIATNAFSSMTHVLSNVGGFFLSFILVGLTTYYLLRDGKALRNYVTTVLPLSQTHQNALVSRLESAVDGVVKGQFLVAILQGVMATVGFFIFHVPQPFLWGTFLGLAAMVPAVGTSFSFIAVVAFLFVTNHLGAAIGLAIWAMASVALVDNFIAPKIVGHQINLHPLLILFGVLGGIKVFGPIGLLLGPILVAVFVALLDIYRTEAKSFWP